MHHVAYLRQHQRSDPPEMLPSAAEAETQRIARQVRADAEAKAEAQRTSSIKEHRRRKRSSNDDEDQGSSNDEDQGSSNQIVVFNGATPQELIRAGRVRKSRRRNKADKAASSSIAPE